MFSLTDEHARLGKISNNLERHGDEDTVTGFTLPLKLRIDRNQLLELMGAEFNAAAWLGSSEAVPWIRRVLPLALEGETYAEVKSAIIVGGNLEPAHGKELLFENCRVSQIKIVALAPGGITEIHCHLYVRPGIGSENLLLQEYQEREVAVQMTSGKLRVKADKAQQDLPLNDPSNPPTATSTSPGDQPQSPTDDVAPEGETTVIDDSYPENDIRRYGGVLSETATVEVRDCKVTLREEPTLSIDTIKRAREILAKNEEPLRPWHETDEYSPAMTAGEVALRTAPEQPDETPLERERRIAAELSKGRKHREQA